MTAIQRRSDDWLIQRVKYLIQHDRLPKNVKFDAVLDAAYAYSAPKATSKYLYPSDIREKLADINSATDKYILLICSLPEQVRHAITAVRPIKGFKDIDPFLDALGGLQFLQRHLILADRIIKNSSRKSGRRPALMRTALVGDLEKIIMDAGGYVDASSSGSLVSLIQEIFEWRGEECKAPTQVVKTALARLKNADPAPA